MLPRRHIDHDEEQAGATGALGAVDPYPGHMVHFKSANAQISVLFTIPLGFATGMLAATIAVGGFIGVPGMIYVLGVPSHDGLGHRTGDRLRHGPGRHDQVCLDGWWTSAWP